MRLEENFAAIGTMENFAVTASPERKYFFVAVVERNFVELLLVSVEFGVVGVSQINTQIIA